MEVRLQARARDKHEKATKETLQRLHQVLSTRGSRFHSEYLPSTFLIVPLSFYIYISRFFPCLYEKGLKSTRERSHTATKLRGRLPLREAVPLRLISRCIYVYNLSPDDVFLCEDFFTSYYFLTLGSLWFRKSLKREVEYIYFFPFFDLERKFAKDLIAE